MSVIKRIMQLIVAKNSCCLVSYWMDKLASLDGQFQAPNGQLAIRVSRHLWNIFFRKKVHSVFFTFVYGVTSYFLKFLSEVFGVQI